MGVEVGRLRAAADACDAGGEHFEAAQLMWAACAVRGAAAGAEARRAWASLQRLEEAGRGSSVSRTLENRVLGALCFPVEGGFAFGSAEHTELIERIKELGASHEGEGLNIDMLVKSFFVIH